MMIRVFRMIMKLTVVGTGWSKVDVATWNGEAGAANTDDEVGKGGRAGEGVTTLAGVVGSAGNLSIVGVDDGVWEEKKSGTGISNTADAGGCKGAADTVSG